MSMNSLVGKLSVLFLCLLFLVSISVIATFWGVDAQKKDALVINLAGRQRMLIQQMSRLALEIERRDNGSDKQTLQESMSVFEQTQQALRDGGAAPYLSESYVELPGTRSAAVLAQLDELIQSWGLLKGNLEVVLSAEPGSEAFGAAVISIEQASPVLVKQADLVVRWYEAAASQKVTRLKWFQIIFLISALALLAIGGMSTLKSVIQPLSALAKESKRIGEGDLRSAVEISGPSEIQALGAAFDAMRSQLKVSIDETHAWAETLEEKVAQRTQELEALNKVCREISAHLDISQVLGSVTDKARRLLGGDVAYLCMLDAGGDILNLQANSGPQDAVMNNISAANSGLASQILSSDQALMCGAQGCSGQCQVMPASYQDSLVAAPLRIGNQITGAICVGASQPGRFVPDAIGLLTRLANATAVALENARLYEQAERIAILEERQRLAADMHDGVAQTLSYLLMMVDLAADQAGAGSVDEAIGTLERSRQAIDHASLQTRRAISSLQEEIRLHNTLQEQLGALMGEFSGDDRIEWMPQLKSPLVVPNDEMEQVVKIVQEALLNAQKHSHAGRISVRVLGDGSNVKVEIEDDGCGFDPDSPIADDGRGHFGLNIMQARAARLGAKLRIESGSTGGSLVRLDWPVDSNRRVDG